MKKAFKVLSFLGALTGLASTLTLSLLVYSGQVTPPRLDSLPGRPAAILAPTTRTAEAWETSPYRRFWLRQNGCDRLDREPTVDCLSLDHWLLSGEHVEAAHSPKLSNTGANAEADALATLMNTGYIKIYNGTQPAGADTAVSTQTLGATLRFSSTAFGSSSAGVATANTITSDTDAAATITATWFRILKSDNSTVLMDGSVCTSGCDINLATVSIVQHATVAISAFTLTQGKG